MTPSPYYYRLPPRYRLPGASGTPDAELSTLGARVQAVEQDANLLPEARRCLHIADLSGAGLRKVTPGEHPANAETKICERLQQLESEDRIKLIYKQGLLD